ASTSKDEFPEFDDGDVEIRLTRQPQHRFVLHSFILGLHSSFFKASLNQRWSGGEAEGYGNIKWRYELAFDGDGMGLLCKQTSNDGPEVLFFRQNLTPPMSVPKKKLAARLEILEAHVQYLKAIYYVPFSICSTSSGDGLQQISRLVTTGDLYNNVKPLRVHIECFVNGNLDALRQSLQGHGPDWLQIAMKLEIAWLFKEIMSRACVNSGMSDQQVIKDFTPAMSSLILRKREALKTKLTEIDMKLLMFKSPSGYSASHDVAVLEVRERISKHLRLRQRGPWSKYARAYADIVFYLEKYDVDGGDSTWEYKEGDRIYTTLEKIQRKVFEIIEPLYDDGLDALCKKREIEGDGFVVPDVDYKCIEVLDGDLPWNTGL
ncbi:MAG: hypothetical protein Q9204_006700, partial [Flavoplaca sp. TL-2023a]